MLVQDSLLYLNFFMVEGSVQQCLYITYDLTLNTDTNLPIIQSHSFELHHSTIDMMRSSGDKAHTVQIPENDFLGNQKNSPSEGEG